MSHAPGLLRSLSRAVKRSVSSQVLRMSSVVIEILSEDDCVTLIYLQVLEVFIRVYCKQDLSFNGQDSVRLINMPSSYIGGIFRKVRI